MSSAVALSEPSIDSRLLAGSATSCSSEAHACGVMSLPCKWQRRRVLVWASDADLEGSRWWGAEGRSQEGSTAAAQPLYGDRPPSLAPIRQALRGEPAGFGLCGQRAGCEPRATSWPRSVQRAC